MGIYEAWKKARGTRQKEVAIPASVAMSTADLAIGEEVDLLGSDEFFARIALEIDETLKGAKQ